MTKAWMGAVLIPHDCEDRRCATSPYRAGPYHDLTDEAKDVIRRAVDIEQRESE